MSYRGGNAWKDNQYEWHRSSRNNNDRRNKFQDFSDRSINSRHFDSSPVNGFSRESYRDDDSFRPPDRSPNISYRYDDSRHENNSYMENRRDFDVQYERFDRLNESENRGRYVIERDRFISRFPPSDDRNRLDHSVPSFDHGMHIPDRNERFSKNYDRFVYASPSDKDVVSDEHELVPDERELVSDERELVPDERDTINEFRRRRNSRSDFFGGNIPLSGKSVVNESHVESRTKYFAHSDSNLSFIHKRREVQNNRSNYFRDPYDVPKYRNEENYQHNDLSTRGYSEDLRFERDMQKAEEQDQSRYKDVVMQHLKEKNPNAVEDEEPVLNIDEITKILNNPSLKQLLERVNTIEEKSEQEQKRKSEEKKKIEEKRKMDVSVYKYDDDIKAKYHETNRKRHDSDIILLEDRDNQSNSSNDEIFRSIKIKDDSPSYSSPPRKKSKDRRSHSSRKKSLRKRKYEENSRPHKSKASRRSKDIENFLINAADIALKTPKTSYLIPPTNMLLNNQIIPIASSVNSTYPTLIPLYHQPATQCILPSSNKKLDNSSKAIDRKRKSHSSTSSRHHSRSSESRRSKHCSSESRRSSLHHSPGAHKSKHHSSSRKTPSIRTSSLSLKARTGSSGRMSYNKQKSLDEMISEAKRGSKFSTKLCQSIEHSNIARRSLKEKVKSKNLKKTSGTRAQPWFDDSCKEIRRKMKITLRSLGEAKAIPKNCNQVGRLTETLQKVTREYTALLKHRKADYFKSHEGNTQEFCQLVLNDIVERICSNEKRAVVEVTRISALNKKYGLNIPLPSSDNSLTQENDNTSIFFKKSCDSSVTRLVNMDNDINRFKDVSKEPNSNVNKIDDSTEKHIAVSEESCSDEDDENSDEIDESDNEKSDDDIRNSDNEINNETNESGIENGSNENENSDNENEKSDNETLDKANDVIEIESDTG